MADLSTILPSADVAATVLLAFLAGATAPSYFAAERFRGFGRAMLSRLPYQAPPGMDDEQAMLAALESAGEHHVDESDPSGERRDRGADP